MIKKDYQVRFWIIHWQGILVRRQAQSLAETKGGGMLRFWNVLVLVLVLNFESFFCDLLASVGLVNKNGYKGQH